MTYSLIIDSASLCLMIEKWNKCERIAVDFECEFNLHIYGEHLCLIQIYDGSGFYIIDPRSNAVSRESLIGFFLSPVKKVWFDCQSDNALVFKKYSVGITNICDVRVYAMALGFKSNLISLEKELLGLDTAIDPAGKKQLQQTDWTKRPLSDAQLEYALSDVENLFALEDVLYSRVRKARLEKLCAQTMAERTKPKAGRPGWTGLGDWRRMNKAERQAVKQYYLARDAVARRFNVPSFYVLDKHLLLKFALSLPKTKAEVESFVASASPRFQSQLRISMLRAFDILHQG